MMELFKNRLTIGLVLFYAFGIFIGTHFFSTYFILIGSFLAVLFVILSIVLFKNTKRTVSLGICVCIIFLVGGALYSNYTSQNRQKELRSFANVECRVYGTVISKPTLTQKGNHYSVTVDVHKIVQNNKSTNLKGRIILYVSRLDNTAPKLNQCIYFYTKLEPPEYEDGNFSYNEFLRTKDIYLTGFTDKVYPYTGYDRSLSLTDKIKETGRKINSFFSERVDILFDYDQDTKAMAKGILLGEKGDFSDELNNNLSLAGFSHIAAVSGLHLNILFGALCGLFGFLMIHRKITVFIALPVILIFSAITGFTPSVCRSAIMLVICILSIFFKKEYDSLNALFVSAFIILTANPYALYSISFILSFISTLTIILLYEKLYSIFKLNSKFPKIIKGLASSISVSTAAFIGTAPFVAYYFGIVSFSSFFANIWVVPLTAPIFICGYILCIISTFLPDFICNLLLYPLAFWIEILIQTANFFAKMSFLHFEIDEFSPIYIIIYAIIITFIFRKRKSSPKA